MGHNKHKLVLFSSESFTGKVPRIFEFIGKPGKVALSVFLIFSSFFFTLGTAYGQSAESCPEPSPEGTFDCDYNTVELYVYDLSGSPSDSYSEQINKDSGALPCCNDELNSNAQCAMVELRLHPNAVGIRINVEGANGSSGSFRISPNTSDICSVSQISFNSLTTTDEFCLSGSLVYYIPFCKPGGNDYCVEIESIAADNFGDEVILIDDQVNCSYEVNVGSSVELENIVWTSISGDLSYLDCGGGTLDCLNPIFTPPGNLNSEETYEYQVCGEWVDATCGNLGVEVCDTVIITVIPQIEVILEENVFCPEEFPAAVIAEFEDDYDGIFDYYWYNGYDLSGTLLGVSSNPEYDIPGPGQYSLYVVDNNLIYGCIRTFIYNFDITESLPPESIIDLINFDECSLTVTVNGGNSIDNYLDDNLQYFWDFGDGGSATFESGTHTYSGCGEFWILLEVVDPDIEGPCPDNVSAAVINLTGDPNGIDFSGCDSGDMDAELTCDTDAAQWNQDNIDYLYDCAFSTCGDITVSSDFSIVPEVTACSNQGDHTVTYTITGPCGFFEEITATLTIEDTEPPVIVCPDPITVACEIGNSQPYLTVDDFVLDGGTVVDNCSTEGFSINLISETENNVIGNCGQYIREYEIIDQCGNVTTCEQIVNVVDNENPVLISPPDISVYCSIDNNDPYTSFAEFQAAGGSATDNCSINPASFAWIIDLIDVNEACAREYLREYYIEDNCGNYITVNQRVIIYDDVPPVVTCDPISDSFECLAADNIPNIEAWNADNIALLESCSTDECRNVSVTSDYDYANFVVTCQASGSITVNYTITDDCGNAVVRTATLTITDGTDPVVACPADFTMEGCSEADLTNGATSLPFSSSESIIDIVTFEAEGGTVTPGLCDVITYVSYSDVVTGSCILTVVRTFTLRDGCGNETVCTQEITIQDTTVPTINPGSNGGSECTGSDPDSNADYIAWRDNFAGATATDACSTPTLTFDELGWTQNGCNDVMIIRVTATDDCGNFITADYTYTITDNTTPQIIGGANGSSECTGSNPSDNVDYQNWRDNFANVSTNDVCGNVTLSYQELGWVQSACTDIMTVRVIATDECGLSSDQEFTFTITDTTPPEITGGSNGGSECQGNDPGSNSDYISWRNSFAGVSASDICGDVTLSYTETAWIQDGCTDETTVWITATDECGLTISQPFIYTITDNTEPVIIGGSNGGSECTGSDPDSNTDYLAWRDNFAGVTTNDVCGNVSLSVEELGWNQNACTDVMTIRVTATDECGLSSEQEFTYTITDTTIPAINAGSNEGSECTGSDPNDNADYISWRDNFAGVTASDICGDITLSYEELGWVQNGCTDIMTLRVIATDECGLTNSIEHTFTITDTTPPEIFSGSDDGSECTGSNPGSNADYLAWRDNFAGVTASDICGNVTLTFIELGWIQDGCTDEMTIRIIATDECGLTNSLEHTYTITDTTIPEITGGSDGGSECTGGDPSSNAAYIAWRNNFAGISSSDICGNVTLAWEELGWVQDGCTDEMTIRITSTDECGLTNDIEYTYFITDSTIPAINPGSNGGSECTGSDPSDNAGYIAWRDNFAGVTSSDICGDITLEWEELGWVQDGCTDVMTLRVTATDECGLTNSIEHTYTITDTTIPSIFAGNNEGSECTGSDPSDNSDYIAWRDNFAGVTADDICGDVTLSFVELGWVQNGCTDVMTLRVIATDECGLTNSLEHTYTITDTTIPEINAGADGDSECTGSNPALDANYIAWRDNFAGVTSSDICGNVVLSWEELGWVQDGCTDVMTIRITATDECGLTNDIEHTYTITDTTIPAITPGSNGGSECTGSDPYANAGYIAWRDSYAGVTSNDICGNITLAWEELGWVQDGCTDVMTIRVTATDECGLTNEIEHTYTITDTTIPTIVAGSNGGSECEGSDPGSNSGYLAWRDNYAGVTSSDICGDVELSWEELGWVQDGCTDIMTLRVTATDECGLTNSIEHTYTIVDTTIPEINAGSDEGSECTGSDPGSNAAYLSWRDNFAGVTSSDICGDVTLSWEELGWVQDGCTDMMTIRVTATDECGLTNSLTHTYTITDTTVPEINAGSDGGSECEGSDPGSNSGYLSWRDNFAGVTSSDICGDVTLSYVELGWVQDGCTDVMTIRVIATDECGLTNDIEHTYTITDTTIPAIVAGSDGGSECTGSDPGSNAAYIAWRDNFAGVTSSDICGNIVLSWEELGWVQDGCTDVMTIRVTATDECGLTNDIEHTYTITDTTIPSIVAGSNGGSECEGSDPGSNSGYLSWRDNFAGVTSSDICGDVELSWEELGWVQDGCTDVMTLRITATDECGLTNSIEHVYTIVDTTIPEINAGSDEGSECTGSDPGSNTSYQAWRDNFAGVTANDICGDVTLNWEELGWVQDGCTDVMTIRITATDECGLTNSLTHTYTITDTTVPEINPGSDGGSECTGSDPGSNAAYLAWRDNFAGVTSSDICGDIILSYEELGWVQDGCTDVMTIRVTATDECGLTNDIEHTYTITDTTVPAIVAGSDGGSECTGSDPGSNAAYVAWRDNFAGVTSSDICGNIVLSWEELGWVQDGCTDVMTLRVIATDECGLTNEIEHTYTITDTTIPSIVAGSDGGSECEGSDPGSNSGYLSWRDNFAGVTSSDICGDVELNWEELGWVQDGCTDVMTIRVTAMDECGLTNTIEHTYTITDTTVPEINAGSDEGSECEGSDPGSNSGYLAWRDNFAGVTSSDVCGDVVLSWEELGWVQDGCTDVMTIRVTATDECGLTSTIEHTYTITDTTIPEINPGSDEGSECTGSDPGSNSGYLAWRDNFAGVTSNDICGDVVLSWEELGWVQDGCTDVMTLRIIATDECGLTNDIEHTYTIVDTTIPEINEGSDGGNECVGSDPGSNPGYIAWRDNFAGVTSNDICGEVVLSWEELGWVQDGCTDVMTLRVIATDECGLTNEVEHVYTIEDTTIPEITCPSDITLNCPDEPTTDVTGEATGSDLCSEVTITYEDVISVNCGNTYTIARTWTATDECGNTNECVQNITVQDITPPIIECPEDVTISFDDQCGLADTPTDLGEPIVSEECSATTVTFIDDLSNLTECNGTGFFTRIWTVTDECGNEVSCTQTITVIDNSNPQVECPEDVTVYIDENCSYDIDPSTIGFPTVTDNCDQDPTITYTDDNSGLTECNNTGVIIRTFEVTDACGNVTTCVQNITLIDEIAPEVICPPEVTIYYSVTCGVEIDPADTGYPTFTDNCDADPLIEYADDDSGLTECNGTGTIIRTWTVTDACGNVTTCEQTIIVQDNTSPEIICPDEVTVFLDSSCDLDIIPDFTGTPTIIDNCDVNPIITYEDNFDGLTECNGTGTFIRTWTVEDACGNIATCEQTIIVQDNTNPEITCPEDITIYYDENCVADLDPSNTGNPVVTDNCDTDPVITYTDDDSGLTECNSSGTIIRTWSITDACGNTTTCLQNIIVLDTIRPTIICPSDLTIGCPGDIDPSITGFADGSDNCGNVTVEYSDSVEELCPGSSVVTRTWTVIDECGETSSCEQLISIIDDTAPEITCPADITLECDGNYNSAEIQEWLNLATATDDCSNVEITNDLTSIIGDCEGIGEALVTFTATDECGNESTCQAMITIIDTTPPSVDDLIDMTLQYLSEIPEIDVEIVIGEEDLCDPNPIVTWVSDLDNGGSGCNGDPLIITRTYRVADCSENEVFVDEEITVEAPIIEIDAVTTEILCTGESTGTIEVTITGGTAPYDVTWDNSAYNGQTSLTDLASGTYIVYVTDAIGCLAEMPILVTEVPDALQVELTPDVGVVCIDGEVEFIAVATGGVEPYTYEWNLPPTTETTLIATIEGTYSVTVTDANGCSDEAEAVLNVIYNPEIFNPGPLEACDQLILPEIEGIDLSGNQAYYTDASGGGTQYNAGDVITESTTLYIFDETGTEPNCSAEETFEITIYISPDIDPNPGATNCDVYTLPDITGSNLSGNQAYYTEPGGGGTQYNIGDEISSSTTLYMYDEVNGCWDEEPFVVEIVSSPEIDPKDDVEVCNSYTLETITGIGVTGASYWTEPGGNGIEYQAGDVITESTTLYMVVQAGDCNDEEPFNIVIIDAPILDNPDGGSACGVFVLPEINGQNLTGNEAYFTIPQGNGIQYLPGDEIYSSITLYIYDNNGVCEDMEIFEVEIVSSPDIDPVDDVDVCDSYTLPQITGTGVSGAQYYTGPGGTGDSYSAGDVITESVTLYMSVGDEDCGDEEEFNITITPTPILDNPDGGSDCGIFILPEINGTNLTGNEAYFTGADGSGTQYFPGDEIDVTTTLYIYDANGNCVAEEVFEVEIVSSPDIDPKDDVDECDSFTLPTITGAGISGARYYTEPGQGGDTYNAGDIITESITLYMSIGDETCGDEEVFNINITITPDIDANPGATNCDVFILPEITGTNLSGNQAYYTGNNGSGTQYFPGDEIGETTQLFMYDENGDCFDEEPFNVEIVSSPEIDPIDDVTACDVYILPTITGVGVAGARYYTESNGGGIEYSAGDAITETTTLFAYVNAGDCEDETTFSIEITITPDIEPNAGGTACDEFTLPEILGTNLSGNEAYYTDINGAGDTYFAGDIISETTTLYMFDIVGECFDEEVFLVEIVETPDIDPMDNIEVCDQYELPQITGVGVAGARYYSGPSGTGDVYNPGDIITESVTMYVYFSAGECGDEEVFDIVILETPDIDPFDGATACDIYVLPDISGTKLTGNEAYYSESGGQGDIFQPGDEITTSITLYAYDASGICSDEETLVIDIVETPDIYGEDDVIICDQFVLPEISGIGVSGARYYTGPGGTGDVYNGGDIITESGTFYIYFSAGDCGDEEVFEVTILTTPKVDPYSPITSCDSYVLPPITGENLTGNEAYYTESLGNGTIYQPGDIITSSITLFAYDNDGECYDEEDLVIEIVETPDIDPIGDIIICDEYTLPEITGIGVNGAKYYTGPGGTGTELVAGDIITESDEFYIYFSTGDCGDEESFNVTILTTPDIDPIDPVTSCDNYVLPEINGNNLTGSEAYYTGNNGNGTKYSPGDIIDASITLYAYDSDGECSDEEPLLIEIVETPIIDSPADVEVCDGYTLPAITGVGVNTAAYYTGPGGTGDVYNEGDVITETTNIYIYISAGECSDETAFTITIKVTPDIDPINNVTSCDEFILPVITGTNLTGNEAYFTGMNGMGTQYLPGDAITSTTTLYLFDQDGDCFDEELFEIEIVETPIIDPKADVEVCDEYILPEITGTGVNNAAYFTEQGGNGIQYSAGDAISESTELYIYISAGTCADEELFKITILNTPDIDPLANVIICDGFTLPEITGTNLTGNEAYYNAPGGSGTSFAPGDLVTTSTTIYIYDNNGECFDEESFNVDIVETPEIDPIADVEVCDSYVLPEITGTGVNNASFFTGQGGTGTEYVSGDLITETTSLYIYVDAGECSVESSFNIVILVTPNIDPISDVVSCDTYLLPEITGTNLSGNEAYFTEPGGNGNSYQPGEAITENITLYAYDAIGECIAEDQFNIEVISSPKVNNVSSACNDLEPGYKVTFEITGGDPFNYFVNGVKVDNPNGDQPYIFVSESIASETAYSFTVTDINECTLITVEGEGEYCGCISEVGTVDPDLIEICGDDLDASAVYDDALEVLDFNDIRMFALHESADTVLENVIALSFDPVFGFDPEKMNYGQTYYISAVVGNKLSNGMIDLNDECLAVSYGQPVIFYDIPEAVIDGEYVVCLGSSIDIEVELSGVAPFRLVMNVNGEELTFTDIQENIFSLTVEPEIDMSITLISIQDAHCDGLVNGEINIQVSEPTEAEIVPNTEICNLDFKGSVIDLDTLIISGPLDGVWVDMDNSGATMNGSVIDFHGVTPGEYQFLYTVDNTGGVCSSNDYILTVNVLDCSCPIINIGEAGPFCNDDVVFDLSTIENDSEPGFWGIHTSPSGSTPATINGDIFNATGADAGTYELIFTLDEIDPLCTWDTIIQVQVMNRLSSGDALAPFELCIGDDMDIDLSTLLSNADSGGSWSTSGNINGFNPASGLLNTLNLTTGTYTFTYSVDSESPCEDESTEVQVIVHGLPVAEAGPSFELTCDQQEVNLDGSGSSTGSYTYFWTTDDGNVVSGEQTLNPLVDQPGIYYLEVTNTITGCSVLDAVEVTIDEGFPNADAGVDQFINCAQSVVTIDATNTSSGRHTYQWIGPDGNEFFPDDVFLFETSIPGTYTLIVTDTISDCSNDDIVVITDQVSYPELSLDIPDILNCFNATVTINSSAQSDLGGLKYIWETSGGNILNGQGTDVIEVDQPGIYTLTVIDTVNQCSVEEQVEVYLDRDNPIAEAGGSFTLDCILTAVTLEGGQSSKGPEFTYEWTTSNGNIVNGGNTLSPLIDAVGTYYLEVFNTENGCSSMDSVVIDDNIVPVEEFRVETINPCYGDAEGLINVLSVQGGVGPYVYSINGGEFSDNAIWDNLRAGTYQITVKGSNGCSLTKEVVLFEGLDLSIELGEDLRIELGDSVQMHADINIDEALIQSVIWEPFDANISCVECIDPLAWPYYTTTYTATLVDIYGCTTRDDKTIYVDRRTKVYAPNIFSPNGDDDNDFFTLYTDHQIDVILTLKIYSRWGEKVFENGNFKPGVEEDGWDGTFKGQKVNPGVFAWYGVVQLVDGTERLIKGDVTVVR